MDILIVDNYDSFVYNVVGLLRGCRDSVGGDLSWDVVRNDTIPFDRLDRYDAIILSPGPGVPQEAGDLMRLVGVAAGRVPMLGICLGHQAIALHYGARLRQLEHPRHGHPSALTVVDASDPVIGTCSGTQPVVGRYHSWVVDEAALPPVLFVTSRDEEGNIMSFRHFSDEVYGVQFHPESIITSVGAALMDRFIARARSYAGRIDCAVGKGGVDAVAGADLVG